MGNRSGKPIGVLADMVKNALIAKIEHGTRAFEGKTFLHTEPHHDDIMLGYLPSVLRSTTPGGEPLCNFQGQRKG